MLYFSSLDKVLSSILSFLVFTLFTAFCASFEKDSACNTRCGNGISMLALLKAALMALATLFFTRI